MSLVIYLFHCTLNCFILFTINSTYFFLSGSYSCHIPQPTHPYLVTFTRTTYTKGEELTPGSAGPSPNRLVVLRIVFNMSRPKGQMPLKKIFVLTVRYFTIITHLCILISFSKNIRKLWHSFNLITKNYSKLKEGLKGKRHGI